MEKIKILKVTSYNLEAGPFSFFGVCINDLYKLRVEREIKTNTSLNPFNKKFWSKPTYTNKYILYDIVKDKSKEINENYFKVLVEEIKKLDTDSANYFLNKVYSFCKFSV